MIDIKKCISLFNKYVKNYDLTVKDIMYKFHHTYRVMNYAEELAVSLNLNEEDTKIAMLTGLLHDISRFEQWTKYNTYEDSQSFDHGDYGEKILRDNNFISEFVKDKETQELVIYCVKNHNKYAIEEIDNERYQLFAKLVRDADKMDILLEQNNFLKEENQVLDSDVVKELFKKELCNNKKTNQASIIIRNLSFVFDINYNYAFKFIKEKRIIENKMHLLELYTSDIEKVYRIKEFLINYVNERCE